jgi:membrane-bound ClpP family serine protease
MSPILLVIVLFAAAAVLFIAEMALPTQGVLGVIGVLAIVAGIAVGFHMGQWIGLAILLGTLLAAPFAMMAAMNLWPRTPIGRRLLLQAPPKTTVQPPHVGLGQTGVAVSDLRPMGWCEFNGSGNRHEAQSEIGLIPAGRAVKVVTISNGRLIVREC